MSKNKRQAKPRARKNTNRRRAFLSRSSGHLNQGKRFRKKEVVAILGLIVAIMALVASYVFYRFSNDLPDLRVVKVLGSEDLDYKFDANNNLISLSSTKILVRNMSFKSGYIDKVELYLTPCLRRWQ